MGKRQIIKLGFILTTIALIINSVNYYFFRGPVMGFATVLCLIAVILNGYALSRD